MEPVFHTRNEYGMKAVAAAAVQVEMIALQHSLSLATQSTIKLQFD